MPTFNFWHFVACEQSMEKVALSVSHPATQLHSQVAGSWKWMHRVLQPMLNKIQSKMHF